MWLTSLLLLLAWQCDAQRRRHKLQWSPRASEGAEGLDGRLDGIFFQEFFSFTVKFAGSSHSQHALDRVSPPPIVFVCGGVQITNGCCILHMV